jgi:hypothetical protein
MASKLIFSVGVTAAITASLVWSGDFRDNDWGDSPEAVQAKEGEGFVWRIRPPGWGNKDYTGAIGYNPANHLGDIAVVLFDFTTEEKLGMAMCFSHDRDILSFSHWEEALSKAYGEPDNRDDVLINDEDLLARYYRGDVAAVKAGILSGYFALVRYWETETTDIWLVAELHEGKLEVHIHYYSKEYFEFFCEEKKRGGSGKGYRPYFDD